MRLIRSLLQFYPSPLARITIPAKGDRAYAVVTPPVVDVTVAVPDVTLVV